MNVIYLPNIFSKVDPMLAGGRLSLQDEWNSQYPVMVIKKNLQFSNWLQASIHFDRIFFPSLVPTRYVLLQVSFLLSIVILYSPTANQTKMRIINVHFYHYYIDVRLKNLIELGLTWAIAVRIHQTKNEYHSKNCITDRHIYW